MRWLGGIAAIGVLAFVIATEDPIAALQNLAIRDLAIIALLSIAHLAARGRQLRTVAHVFDVTLKPSEATGVAALQSVTNYLPGRAGVAVRGVYLNRVHRLPVSEYTALTALWLAGSLLVAAVVGGALSLSGYASDHRSVASGVFIAMGMSIILGFALAMWVGRRLHRGSRVSRWLVNVHRGLGRWRESGHWQASFIFWSLTILTLQGLRYWVALGAVGVSTAWQVAILMEALIAMSILISITPGNIGVQEGVAGFAAYLTGINIEVAVLAAVVTRAADLLVCSGAAVLLGRPITAKLRKNQSHGGQTTRPGEASP